MHILLTVALAASDMYSSTATHSKELVGSMVECNCIGHSHACIIYTKVSGINMQTQATCIIQ